jgi:putative SbcD/Mre11-related phosphoesterase
MRFIYGEPAMLISEAGSTWLVVGDIHIGAERRLNDKGVRVYELWKNMSDKIAALAKTFSATGIIMLGDIKDSIMYPESWEQRDIRRFMDSLSGFELKLIRGNHDGHMEEILGSKLSDEILIGNYALMHGNKWPSKEAMQKRVIITGHNHIAVRITDENGGVFSEKAWLIAKGVKKKIREFYVSPKAESMIVLPAFNPLILGSPVGYEMPDKENISPLFRNNLFDYQNADIYSIGGMFMGKVKSLSSDMTAKSKKSRKKRDRISP